MGRNGKAGTEPAFLLWAAMSPSPPRRKILPVLPARFEAMRTSMGGKAFPPVVCWSEKDHDSLSWDPSQ
jgi:hypothetical protein